MKNNSDQAVATAATIIAAINWEKLNGTTGEDILQQIQAGFQNDGAGDALTRWLERKEWEIEPKNLARLGYPDWVRERLTPGIDEEEPFSDGTIFRIDAVLGHSSNFPYAFYYKKLKEKPGQLWQCIGLQTLLFFSQNPRPDLAGKRIMAWKSAVLGKRGRKYVPVCSFISVGEDSVVAGAIEWLHLDELCRSHDWTLKIYC